MGKNVSGRKLWQDGRTGSRRPEELLPVHRSSAVLVKFRSVLVKVPLLKHLVTDWVPVWPFWWEGRVGETVLPRSEVASCHISPESSLLVEGLHHEERRSGEGSKSGSASILLYVATALLRPSAPGHSFCGTFWTAVVGSSESAGGLASGPHSDSMSSHLKAPVVVAECWDDQSLVTVERRGQKEKNLNGGVQGRRYVPSRIQ
jgi:hypothetical protein